MTASIKMLRYRLCFYYKPLALSRFSHNSESTSKADSFSSTSSPSLSSSPPLSPSPFPSWCNTARHCFICSTSSSCPLPTSARASLSHAFLCNKKIHRSRSRSRSTCPGTNYVINLTMLMLPPLTWVQKEQAPLLLIRHPQPAVEALGGSGDIFYSVRFPLPWCLHLKSDNNVNICILEISEQ